MTDKEKLKQIKLYLENHIIQCDQIIYGLSLNYKLKDRVKIEKDLAQRLLKRFGFAVKCVDEENQIYTDGNRYWCGEPKDAN